MGWILDLFNVKFGVWTLGCWIFDFFVWERGQGVYIVFTDVFFFGARWGKPFQTPLRYFLDVLWVWILDLFTVKFGVWILGCWILDFLFGKRAMGSTLFSLMGSCCFFRGKVG